MPRDIKSTQDLVRQQFLQKLLGDTETKDSIEPTDSPIDYIAPGMIMSGGKMLGRAALDNPAAFQALKSMVSDAPAIVGNEVGSIGRNVGKGIKLIDTAPQNTVGKVVVKDLPKELPIGKSIQDFSKEQQMIPGVAFGKQAPTEALGKATTRELPKELSIGKVTRNFKDDPQTLAQVTFAPEPTVEPLGNVSNDIKQSSAYTPGIGSVSVENEPGFKDLVNKLKKK